MFNVHNFVDMYSGRYLQTDSIEKLKTQKFHRVMIVGVGETSITQFFFCFFLAK